VARARIRSFGQGRVIAQTLLRVTFSGGTEARVEWKVLVWPPRKDFCNLERNGDAVCHLPLCYQRIYEFVVKGQRVGKREGELQADFTSFFLPSAGALPLRKC
jgi:hypothetical protein